MPTTKLSPAEWRASIPLGMRALARWVGHQSKRPVDLTSGAPASTTDPKTWGTFEQAAAFYERTHSEPDVGVGFVFKEGDGLTFIDLDHVLGDPTPESDQLHVEVAPALRGVEDETYVEVSPSGTGLHVFGIGQLPPNVRHVHRVGNSAVEAYDRARYSTVTGRRAGKAKQLAPIQPRIDQLSVLLGRVEEEESAAPAEPERAGEVIDALSYIDPDISYAEWLKVGMALKAGLGEAGRSAWLAWSSQGAKYVPGEPEEKWTSFRRSGIGLGSVFYLAREAGWGGDEAQPHAWEEFTPVEGGELTLDALGKDDDSLRIIPLSDVHAEKIDWLWKGRLALGHVTLIAGDPGRGKSIVTLDLASRLSRGALLPGETAQREPARVLLLNAEDGQGDTLRPRAEAAGADLARILVLDLVGGGRIPQLPDDIERLERVITKAGDVKLVVLDPVNAFIPLKLDAYKDQHVRQALAPLMALAARLHVAVLLVAHLNKANDTVSALYRVSGSVGLGAAARSVLFVGPDPEDDDRRIVAQAKPQLGPPPPALAFTVKGSAADPDVGLVEWLGEAEVEADDLVAKPDAARKATRLEQAQEWLSMFLSGGPQSAADVVAAGRLMHFGEKTLRRAHDALGGKRTKDGMNGGWTWQPPPRVAEVPAGPGADLL